jgi:hypothetical protein
LSAGQAERRFAIVNVLSEEWTLSFPRTGRASSTLRSGYRGTRGTQSRTRIILDTGIAALHLDRKRGVFERAAAEVARGNRVGIAAPVLAQLAFRAEGGPQRDRNILRLRQALRCSSTAISGGG